MKARKFYEILEDLDAISQVEIELFSDVDIYGFEPRKFYDEFRMKWFQEFNCDYFSFIEKVECWNYGFVHLEEVSLEDRSVYTGYDNTSFKIEEVKVNPFSNIFEFAFLMKGDITEIHLMANQSSLYLPLRVAGCPKNNEFWKKMLYQSFMLYKAHDLLGCFMNMFIAFEGMLRFNTGDGAEVKLNDVYYNYTGYSLPRYLKAYRNLRNQIMHGNEGEFTKLSKEDLMILLINIHALETNKSIGYPKKDTKVIKRFSTKSIK